MLWIVLVLVLGIGIFLAWPFLRAQRTWKIVAGVFVLLISGAGLYVWQTNADAPEDFALPGLPLAEQHPEIEELITGLRAKLAQDPSNIQGWLLLARSEAAVGRLREAIEAYETALRDQDDVPALILGDYVEMLIQAERKVSVKAQAVLERILREDPEDARALYYDALGQEERGAPDKAYEQLVALGAAHPADAPFQPMLREQLERMSGQYGYALPDAAPAPAAARGPTAEDVRAAMAMSDEDRQSMINGMVAGLAARLEENPNDREGWQKLIRAYRVLGKEDEAKAAEARLEALAR